MIFSQALRSTTSLTTALAAVAVAAAGGAARARADEASPGTGAASLVDQMRRRLDAEEGEERERLEEGAERTLREFLTDIDALPLGRIEMAAGSPSDGFLRAVAPEAGLGAAEGAVVRRGFDRWAARELAREWKRRYRSDLGRRRAAGGPAWEYELDEEAAAFERAFDAQHAARWNLRFPAYWDEHPASAPRAPRTSGEEIEVARLGALTVENDFEVRLDLRSALPAGWLPPSPAEALGAAARPAAARPSRGTIFATENVSVDARLHVAASPRAIETGFVKRVGGEVRCNFHDDYDGRRLAAVKVEVAYEPADAETSASVACELLTF